MQVNEDQELGRRDVAASAEADAVVGLLPCPFCGKPPALVTDGPDDYDPTDSDDWRVYHVFCENENCVQPGVYGDEIATTAIVAWNTRATAWQPIETAPKDGTEVLLGHANSIWLDYWTMANELDGFWAMCDQWEDPEVPTHWMPLPAAPQIQRTGTDASSGLSAT